MPAALMQKNLTVKGLLKMVKGLPTYGRIKYDGPVPYGILTIADLRLNLTDSHIIDHKNGTLLILKENLLMVAAKVGNRRLTLKTVGNS